MNALTEHRHLFEQTLTQLEVRFDAEDGVMWSRMKPSPRPCYTAQLLEDIRAHESMIESLGGRIYHEGKFAQVRYMVFASAVPGIYNLGGDLATFRELIERQDRATLERYALLCIENIWRRYRHFDAPVTTVALIQGQAMGGGLEGALPADFIIAERSAMLGLPEVIFNLFPGMGALSFLSRKIGMRAAEEMIASGKSYSAQEMADLGVVDLVCDDGYGEIALHDWIHTRARRGHALQAIQKAKQRVNPVTLEELRDVVLGWVDAALTLSPRDLRVMERLISAQNRHRVEAPRAVAAEPLRVAA
jgi:DSF synthase